MALIKSFWALRLLEWMALATSSFPVPLSPRITTVAWLLDTLRYGLVYPLHPLGFSNDVSWMKSLLGFVLEAQIFLDQHFALFLSLLAFTFRNGCAAFGIAASMAIRVGHPKAEDRADHPVADCPYIDGFLNPEGRRWKCRLIRVSGLLPGGKAYRKKR